MSMPVTFTAPPTPTSAPSDAGFGAESGALFGDVLSGLTRDGGSSDGEPTEESLDAMSAATAGPLGAALLVGLNLPIGDARTQPAATDAPGVGTGAGAPTPIGGTGVPVAAPGNLLPTHNGASAPGQPGAFTVPGQPTAPTIPVTPGQPAQALPGMPGALGAPVSPGANAPGAGAPGAPAASGAPGAPGAPAAPGAPGAPGTGAPGAPGTGAPGAPGTGAPGASGGPAAPSGLPQTTVNDVGQTGQNLHVIDRRLSNTPGGGVSPVTVAGAPVPTAPGAPGITAAEPATRTAGARNAVTSTVDTGVPGGTGSTVETAVRSGNAFADTSSGQDRGDSALPRGPEAGWAPTLAAARADSAAPTASAAPTTSTAAQPQLPPAAQLALRLAPLRAGPDGTHQLTILLNPEELGPVSVVATVKGDQLSVQLTGATEAGRDAMRAALPQLERDLREGGFATLNLNVREAPLTDPVRPAWAAPTASAAQGAQPTQPAQQPVGPQPATQAAQPAPATTPVTPTATDFATDGTATATAPAKNDGQPIGQIAQPDGFPTVRRDDTTGQYSPAVAAAAQSPGAQFNNNTGTGSGSAQQQSLQLNLGQPGGQPGQPHPNHPGHAGSTGQQQNTGPEYDAPVGHSGPGEPDPRAAEHRAAQGRTENRSVDLRV